MGLQAAHVWSPQEASDPERLAQWQWHDWRLLAEGDSWFSLGGFPPANLLHELRFPVSVVVLNLAFPGDTVGRMMRGMGQFGRGVRNWLVPRGSGLQFDGMLVSGGGNDLIAAVPTLLTGAPRDDVTRASRWVDEAKLYSFLRHVQGSFAGLAALRPDTSLPIVCHTYDYPAPGDAPALAFGVPVAGPWLRPALDMACVPVDLWQPLARYLIDRLAEALLQLPGQIENLHVVDTRGVLTPESPHWDNEIHPNATGYALLADRVATKLTEIL